MRAILTPALATLLGLTGHLSSATEEPMTVSVLKPVPVIEVAILLDTSGSMEGLINQARTRLWSIINDLARTTRDGKIPDIRVALYEYGNSRNVQESHWVRQVLPLTDDLDAVSAALFALTTDGGEEYCGAVIHQAITDLAWTSGDSYKAVFIAGNEPFTQGPVAWDSSCREAISHGIVVNTILCGSGDETWAAGARLADGEALTIDQNAVQVVIAAPQDARLSELNLALNGTYLAYGEQGGRMMERQAEQDANAQASAPASFAGRAQAKSSAAYRNGSWDLVDAVKEQEVDLASMDEKALPAELRGLDAEQRAAVVTAKAEERRKITEEITKIASEREAFILEKRRELSTNATDDFGAVVSEALSRQLSARGYTQTK